MPVGRVRGWEVWNKGVVETGDRRRDDVYDVVGVFVVIFIVFISFIFISFVIFNNVVCVEEEDIDNR